MRSYENSGYNPYNDNDRGQTRGSARNYYSDEFDLTGRGQRAHGSDSYQNRSGAFGSERDVQSTSGYGGTSMYGRSAGSGNYGGSNYGSSSNRYSSNDRNRYGENRDSWDRAGDRIENAWERTKDKASSAWNRATNDRDRDNDRNTSYNRNYGSGITGSTYGTSYGHDTGYSNDYDRNRYSSSNNSMWNRNSSWTGDNDRNSNWNRDNDRNSVWSSSTDRNSVWDRDRNRNWDNDNDHDRGFMEKAGDEVKSWFGDEEAERRRRMDEMHDRDHDRDRYNRYGSSSTNYGNTYNGPPYSYGSSSRRDYEW